MPIFIVLNILACQPGQTTANGNIDGLGPPENKISSNSNHSADDQGSLKSNSPSLSNTLITDFYQATINKDGSLTFTEKNSGAIILAGSPHFFMNYDTGESEPRDPDNNSFENDTGDKNLPDDWLIDSPDIRSTNERASEGRSSLLFNLAKQDTAHRHAYSSLLAVTANKTYTISVDAYTSNLTNGDFKIFIAYYTTNNGSGKQYISDNYGRQLIATRSWVTVSFDWIPPDSARSYRILIYADKSTTGKAFFDKVRVQEYTRIYYTNGAVRTDVTANGTSYLITSVDDTNPYVRVLQKYEIVVSSPYIRYSAILQYKRDAEVDEERFDFTTPTVQAKVMTRDLKLIDVQNSKSYWSDLFTPKVVKFNNGLTFLGADNMSSMMLSASNNNSRISFYSDNKFDHPYFRYIKNGGGSKVDVSNTKRSAGDSYAVFVTFGINTKSSPKFLVKTRQPYGYDAILTLSNHADSEKTARLKAIAYGTEDENDPTFGVKGIVGRGIGWTKSVFVSGQPGGDLQDSNFKSLTDKMYQDGVEIIGHTITPGTDDRATVLKGLTTLS